MLKPLWCLLVLMSVSHQAAAQSLSERIKASKDGRVRLSFAARAGVCADDGFGPGRSTDEWQPDCRPQLVRVALRVASHGVHSVKSYVGGRWLPDTAAVDLGTVGAREAGEYFLALSERDTAGQLDGDALLPAVLADSITIWPALLRIARSPRLPQETRGRAVFWLGQAAGAAAGQAVDSIASDERGDREVRKHAIFALSQRPTNEGVPALIRIARANTDAELRKTALFWLGQSGDPRAVSLFEEILR